ncbi:tyrosine-type recombinase/integrase [Sphingomonas oligoaromativorans]|uniref:tyrosine-type recombinase/integrase n=1 Tax=Sphingomonas oligoaromativorans TaxID=575322 RepID=UPI0014232139|nr:integrase arm-type DNA-binding domain-containing protein [Sphingomonas oligoaromativorans]NIJ32786.1 integrase [Sphingomonas oligoaromativorans]
MALTEIVIRQAKAGEKARKLADGKGLYLLLTTAGGKLWRFDYRQNGKRGTLSLGQWPEISLAEARAKRDDARKMLSDGSDPALEKRRAKARAKGDVGNTFKAIADEYIAMRKADGARPYSASTAAKAEWHAALLAPSIGHMPVASIEPSDILAALRKIEAKGTLETANRCLQFAGRVMRYAVATARLASDPSRDLKGALPAPRVTHYAAILDPVKLGGLLRAIDSYDGDGVTRLALQLAPHVFVRPGELRNVRWEDLDLAAAIWTIPAEKTKMRKPHSAPLSRQALAILGELEGLTGGREGYQGFVFPSIRTRLRPMSENTLNAALRRLGYSSDEMTAHGFRATASTLLNESGKWSMDAIERALAHGHSDAVRGAYARGQHWDERVRMAQWWSDHLDTLRIGAKVLPLTKFARE